MLTKKDWLPVHAQVALTEAIVDEFLGGDLRALYPLLVEDTRASLGRIEQALIRSLGPGRALQLGPRTFRQAHERGTVEVDVSGRSARLRFAGSPLFAHPSWRVLQLFAQQVLLELAGSPGEAVGEDDRNPDSFTVAVRW